MRDPKIIQGQMAELKKQRGCNYCNGSQGGLTHRDIKMANKAVFLREIEMDSQQGRYLYT